MHDDPTIVRIPLNNRKDPSLVAIVDAADYPKVAGLRWRVRIGQNGRVSVLANIKTDQGRITVSLSRFIMDAPPGTLIDHKDGDRLNNRRTNLREATHQQNMQNTRRHTGIQTSRYKGVHLPSTRRKFIARITIDGKKVHLGCFDEEKDAARAYDRAARKHYGEFACVNFPRKGEQRASRGTRCVPHIPRPPQ